MCDWKSVLLLPTAQVKENCDWWEGLVHMQDMWKYTTIESGGLCVVMAGICWMPQSPVINWAMAELWLYLGMLLMEEEVVQFFMTL